MTLAVGSRNQLLAKVQSGFGTLATGNWTKQRYNTHSLKPVKGTVESAEIRSDRLVSDYRHTTKSWSGDVECELCDADHELFIQSMMFNTWGTDTITVGTTPQYLSLEDGQLDITQYASMKDGIVSQGRFQWSTDQIVKATFSLVGTTWAQSGSTSGGTAVSAGTTSPFNAIDAALFDNAPETGSELAIITSLDMTVDNGARPIFAIGTPNAVGIEYGRARISGSLTAYYQDDTFINRLLNETTFALVMNMTDPSSNSVEYRMERVKLTGLDMPLQNEQSRMITCQWMALAPTSGTATSLQITRN